MPHVISVELWSETGLFGCFRLSVSTDLRVDAERDLRDIGAGKIEIHPLNKVHSSYLYYRFYNYSHI